MLRQRLSPETTALLKHLMQASTAPRERLIRAVTISDYILTPCFAYELTLLSQSRFKDLGSCVDDIGNVVSFKTKMINTIGEASAYRVTTLFLSRNNFPVADIRSLVDAFQHHDIPLDNRNIGHSE